MITLTAKISSELHEKIRNFCEDKGITVSEFVRKSLLQGLQQVYPSGKPVKLEGDTGIQGGRKMEDKDLLQLTRDLTEKIESLRLERVEDRHNFEKSLEGLSRAIQDLKRSFEDLESAQKAREEELRTIRSGLFELSERVIDKSSLAKSLEELCRSDPDNPLCRIAREEGRKAAKDIIEEAKPEGEVRIGHPSWEEVWACPECRETLIDHIFRYGVWDDVKKRAKEEGLLEEKKEDEEERKRAFF